MPLIYIVICVSAWVSFASTNHDGLANLGLVLVTMPTSIIERAIGYQIHGSYENLPFWEPMLTKMGLPSGYYWNHAYWFIPMALLQAACLYFVGKGLEKFINKSTLDKSGL